MGLAEKHSQDPLLHLRKERIGHSRLRGVARALLPPLHSHAGYDKPHSGYRQTQLIRKTFITSSPRWLITFTAMRPDLRLVERARGVAVQGRPGLLVDLGLERRLQRAVGIVRAEEVGVADEEALLVVVDVVFEIRLGGLLAKESC